MANSRRRSVLTMALLQNAANNRLKLIKRWQTFKFVFKKTETRKNQPAFRVGLFPNSYDSFKLARHACRQMGCQNETNIKSLNTVLLRTSQPWTAPPYCSQDDTLAFPVKGQFFFSLFVVLGVFLFVGVKRKSLFDRVKNSKKGGWLPSIPNKLGSNVFN